MIMQNKELLEQLSVDFEKLTGLIQLSAYMMGRINTDNLPDDEETKKNLYKEQKSSSTIHREEKKVYPNDPCPCGSGKKYKKCCGRA